jgi:hypothetical protein
MKIFELRAENVKNIKVVEIRPGDGAVILEGKNGAGKSAILDAIFMAMTGKTLKEPIRNGETRAEINIDLGKYKVRKVFTAKGMRLEVTSADGAAYPSPQALLDELKGDMSFDPLHFAELGKTKPGEREQHRILSDLVGLNFEAIDKDRQKLYDERTMKFREIKGMDPTKYSTDTTKPLAIDALIADMAQPAPGTPREEISMEVGVAKVEALEKKAADYISAKLANEHNQRECDSINKRTKEIGDELRRRIAELSAELSKLEAGPPVNPDIIPLPEEISPEQIAAARQELLDIDRKNKEVRAAVEYDRKIAQLHEAKRSIDELTDKMAKIDLEKKSKVKTAKFPIEGLALEGETVMFNGKPLSQLSTGEQIRVSTAIAMALNPEFKVILVREGSLLDSEGMKAICDIAKDRDYQLWIESVKDKKEVGIYIENGEVRD